RRPILPKSNPALPGVEGPGKAHHVPQAARLQTGPELPAQFPVRVAGQKREYEGSIDPVCLAAGPGVLFRHGLTSYLSLSRRESVDNRQRIPPKQSAEPQPENRG